MEKEHDVAIIGAGISGLAAAYALSSRKKKIMLLEKSHRVGGAIQTVKKEGYLVERAPNSLLVRDKRIARLLSDLAIGEGSSVYQEASLLARKRYILYRGEPVELPSSLIGMLKTPLFSLSGKLRVMAEPFIKKGEEEESFARFVRRRLGREMLEGAAGPFVNGIYAGNPEALSARHAFPRLWALEEEFGSFIRGSLALGLQGTKKRPHRLSPAKMVSFTDGLEYLPKTLSQYIPDGGIQLSADIESITCLPSGRWHLTWSQKGERKTSIADKLLIAIPSYQLGTLPFSDGLAHSLERIEHIAHPPVKSVALGFRREAIKHRLDGFGCLVHDKEASPLLGVLFSSSIFENRAPKGCVLLTAMMGGMKTPRYASNTLSTILEELDRWLGINEQPEFVSESLWQYAIPQYGLDYGHVVKDLAEIEKRWKNLSFVGNWRGGIALGDTMLNAYTCGMAL